MQCAPKSKDFCFAAHTIFIAASLHTHTSVQLYSCHSSAHSLSRRFHLLLTIRSFLWDFYELHHFAYVNSSMPAIFCCKMKWCLPANRMNNDDESHSICCVCCVLCFWNGSVRNWNHRTSISFTTRNRMNKNWTTKKKRGEEERNK